jgi:hypothetical protein
MIRRIVFMLTILWAISAAATPKAAAAGRDDAAPKDLRALQDELANLDDDLKDMEPGDRTADSFRDRADQIREDVTYLKVKMRRHQRAALEGTGVTQDEVADVREEIGRLREDIARSFGEGDGDLRLTEGTEIEVRLEDALSSRTARREDRFEATVLRPVRAGSALAVPAGTRVRGVVRNAEPAERPSRAGKLELEFDALYLDTKRVDLRASLVSMEGSGGRSPAQKAGIGAVLGGIVGALFEGKKGAVVGAVLGGSGAVVATKGEDVELPAGATLTIRLDEELPISRR